MDNKHLQRIKELDETITKLCKIRNNGEYLAAGLKFEVQVGENGETVNFSLGITSDLEMLLKNIITCVQQARVQRVKWAEQELAELQAFFNPPAV